MLLSLKMAVECEQTLSQITNDLHLLQQDAIEASCIHLDITTWLVNLIEKSHLFFDDSDHFIDVTAMCVNQLLFLFQNLFNELLMIRAQIVHVHAVLTLELCFSLDSRIECVHLNCLNWHWASVLACLFLR